jgi:hypothetical protein
MVAFRPSVMFQPLSGLEDETQTWQLGSVVDDI